MSVIHNQKKTLLRLLADLQPHWRRDPGLPSRIQQLLARNRSFGARDRRLYRELIFTTLRYLPWVERALAVDRDEAVRIIAWLSAQLPATHGFKETFATGAPPAGDRVELLPPWFREHCPELFSDPELATQLQRAPLWVRVPAISFSNVTAEFTELGWPVVASEVLSSALRLPTDADVTKSRSYAAGKIEIQDLGSQLILESAPITPGGRWLDACAGAGGKTLQLAEKLGPTGHIDAFDIRADALAELAIRAARAGLRDRISILPKLATDNYDGVLVDAPCSGSGTWRRAPHLKWSNSPQSVAAAARQQVSLLDQFSDFVRPGGLMIYATCSLSVCENNDVVGEFLARHTEFSPVSTLRPMDSVPRGEGALILPSRHDTDGFFVALLRRN